MTSLQSHSPFSCVCMRVCVRVRVCVCACVYARVRMRWSWCLFQLHISSLIATEQAGKDSAAFVSVLLSAHQLPHAGLLLHRSTSHKEMHGFAYSKLNFPPPCRRNKKFRLCCNTSSILWKGYAPQCMSPSYRNHCSIDPELPKIETESECSPSRMFHKCWHVVSNATLTAISSFRWGFN